MFKLEEMVALIAIGGAVLSMLAWIRKFERVQVIQERERAHLLRNYESLALSFKNLDENLDNLKPIADALTDIRLELLQIKMLINTAENPSESTMGSKFGRRRG